LDYLIKKIEQASACNVSMNLSHYSFLIALIFLVRVSESLFESMKLYLLGYLKKLNKSNGYILVG